MNEPGVRTLCNIRTIKLNHAPTVADTITDAELQTMKNRHILSQSATSRATLERLPNIVFMMADDLGYGDLHYTGGEAETPVLDAMAAGPNSVQLTRYYAGSPVCSPTRGTVLTGRNHNRYCIFGPNVGFGQGDFAVPSTMPLPTSEVTVAEILKEGGYRTGIFGKWHIGDLKSAEGANLLYEYNHKWPVSHPGMHGFDDWWVTERSAPTVTTNCGCFEAAVCTQGHYPTPPPCLNYYTRDPRYSDELVSFPSPIEGDDSHFIAQQFDRFLQKARQSGRPFFAYLPFHTVHHRYVATKEYGKRYLDRGMNLSVADYFGSITAMDDAVGQIRHLLKKNHVSDNTMLWFTSDNGPEGHTPGRTGGLRGRKQDLYEGGIRVPGIIEWPAVIKRNRVSDFPVVSSDLLPTVCDILGVQPPNDRQLDGISVLPFLRNETAIRSKPIAWAYPVRNDFNTGEYNAALTSDQYKVFAAYSDGRLTSTELYDLKNDRRETNDLSAEYPNILNSMMQELEDWRQSVIKSARDEVQCLGHSFSIAAKFQRH